MASSTYFEARSLKSRSSLCFLPVVTLGVYSVSLRVFSSMRVVLTAILGGCTLVCWGLHNTDPWV